MTDNAYLKMWSWAAVTYVTLIALMFARTTAGSVPSELFGFISDITSATVPVIGLPVDLLTGLGMLTLSYYWGRMHVHCRRAARIPCFHFLDAEVDPVTTAGKVYRILTFVVVHVFTLIATCQMIFRYVDQSVYRCGGRAVIAGGMDHLDFSLLSLAATNGRLCFGASKAPETFAWLPWLYVVLALIFLGLWAATLWQILAPVHRSPPPVPHS